jgi:hypothetical protein
VAVREVDVVGVDAIAAHLGCLPGNLGPAEAESLVRTLSAAFPPAGQSALVAPVAETSSQDPPAPTNAHRDLRIYYLSDWQGHGHRRLYLKDAHGTQLGWKNAISEEVTLECTGDDRRLAGAVLAGATPTGIALSAQSLPRVPVSGLGRRLLGRFARAHVSVLIGQLWRRKQRLYGTLVDPDASTFKLGYVDLSTGVLRPEIPGPLSKDHQSAEYYLRLLRDRQPAAR